MLRPGFEHVMADRNKKSLLLFNERPLFELIEILQCCVVQHNLKMPGKGIQSVDRNLDRTVRLMSFTQYFETFQSGKDLRQFVWVRFQYIRSAC